MAGFKPPLAVIAIFYRIPASPGSSWFLFHGSTFIKFQKSLKIAFSFILRPPLGVILNSNGGNERWRSICHFRIQWTNTMEPNSSTRETMGKQDGKRPRLGNNSMHMPYCNTHRASVRRASICRVQARSSAHRVLEHSFRPEMNHTMPLIDTNAGPPAPFPPLLFCTPLCRPWMPRIRVWWWSIFMPLGWMSTIVHNFCHSGSIWRLCVGCLPPLPSPVMPHASMLRTTPPFYSRRGKYYNASSGVSFVRKAVTSGRFQRRCFHIPQGTARGFFLEGRGM